MAGEFHFTNVGIGHNPSKPLSLKGFWGLLTIRHHYLLETLDFYTYTAGLEAPSSRWQLSITQGSFSIAMN
jgi:hypothetical protein